MQEQTAVLVYHLDEWVFIVDGNEPERTWQDDKLALADLRADGWEISAGPAIIVADLPDRPRRAVQAVNQILEFLRLETRSSSDAFTTASISLAMTSVRRIWESLKRLMMLSWHVRFGFMNKSLSIIFIFF